MERIFYREGPFTRKTDGEPFLRRAAAAFAQEQGAPFSPDTGILRTKEGKPYFTESPFSFSVSHTAGRAPWTVLWMCLFSDAARCGLDVQNMRAVPRDAVLKRFFTPEEAALAAAGGEKGFYRLWTRREAFGKMTGEGFFGRMPDLRLAAGVWEKGPYVFREIPAGPGVLCTACLPYEPEGAIPLSEFAEL